MAKPHQGVSSSAQAGQPTEPEKDCRERRERGELVVRRGGGRGEKGGGSHSIIHPGWKQPGAPNPSAGV